jgi:hypothetical protein
MLINKWSSDHGKKVTIHFLVGFRAFPRLKQYTDELLWSLLWKGNLILDKGLSSYVTIGSNTVLAAARCGTCIESSGWEIDALTVGPEFPTPESGTGV